LTVQRFARDEAAPSGAVVVPVDDAAAVTALVRPVLQAKPAPRPETPATTPAAKTSTASNPTQASAPPDALVPRSAGLRAALSATFGHVAAGAYISTPTPGAATATEVSLWPVGGDLALGYGPLSLRVAAQYANTGLTAVSQASSVQWLWFTAELGWQVELRAASPVVQLLGFAGYGAEWWHSAPEQPLQVSPSWLRHDLMAGGALTALWLDRAVLSRLVFLAVPAAGLDEEYVNNGLSPTTFGLEAGLQLGWQRESLLGPAGGLGVTLGLATVGRWTSYYSQGTRRAQDGVTPVHSARQELLRLHAVLMLTWLWDAATEDASVRH
jgi:hypothetical protein